MNRSVHLKGGFFGPRLEGHKSSLCACLFSTPPRPPYPPDLLPFSMAGNFGEWSNTLEEGVGINLRARELVGEEMGMEKLWVVEGGRH